MPELSVVVIAQDSDQRALLQVLVDGTTVARTVHTCATFPVAASDPDPSDAVTYAIVDHSITPSDLRQNPIW
jgi:hypothetical protein